ncbi:MAG: L-seryl-tRNA(Sec) selenium transferase, partial [Brachybacterium sp.]|nr:L-seryl-tRNA(Sec) selenium transferase [Brachybacterium sp.]
MPPQPGEESTDPRRRIPRTDHLLALPAVAAASAAMSEHVVRDVVRAAQGRARSGQIAPEQVQDEILTALGDRPAASLRPVLNATGVLVHTNLGRAPLSPSAREALQDAAGYTDVEFDLATGARSRRGAGARAALLAACPEAEDALVVNNGAAALLLATTALAGTGEVVLSRGEMIEIGAGFRLPDLITSTGAQLREVGTTNRTHLADYTGALGPGTGCVLRIHTSNFRVGGFTSEVPLADLAPPCRATGAPLIADLGSGLLRPEPLLPEEPDAATALRDGTDVVIASGDKLLGGPQAGILLGRSEIIARLARHPLARAVRADKLTLAALEATLTGPVPPGGTASACWSCDASRPTRTRASPVPWPP